MITLAELKADFIRRVNNTLFINELRELESEMLNYLSDQEIKAITQSKREHFKNRVFASLGREKSRKINTNLPVGVYETKRGTYQAIIRIDGKQKHLGRFKTVDEAHKAYIKANENTLPKSV